MSQQFLYIFLFFFSLKFGSNKYKCIRHCPAGLAQPAVAEAEKYFPCVHLLVCCVLQGRWMPWQWEDPKAGPIGVHPATGQKPRGGCKKGRHWYSRTCNIASAFAYWRTLKKMLPENEKNNNKHIFIDLYVLKVSWLSSPSSWLLALKRLKTKALVQCYWTGWWYLC